MRILCNFGLSLTIWYCILDYIMCAHKVGDELNNFPIFHSDPTNHFT